MLLYGASLVYGFTGTVSFPASRRRCRAAPDERRHLRPRLRRRRHRLQDLGRAVPHVDAGRLRGLADAGDGLLRRGAEDGRHGDGGARLRRRLSRHPRSVAADHRLHLDRLDGARLLRRDRPAQHQAPDGLFVDRQCRLRARRPRRRHAGRRPGRRHLHGDLSRHDARRLRLHPGPAPRRRDVREHRRSLGDRAHASGASPSASR